MKHDIERLVTEATRETGAVQTRAAARLISHFEREPHRLPELFRYVPEGTPLRPRLAVGVTGAPGSGKSTLTDALISEYRARFPESRVGVIAVDPSSPFTGGAVLGDRVRMMRHATDPLVFIRSFASRGHLGGLSLGVKGALRVMGLIGCDLVFVETVGVGQSEVEVAGVADEVLIVLAPGQGDGVQMLKAGLLEIGDIFALNKADQDGADRLHRDLLGSLQMRSASPGEAMPADSEDGPPAVKDVPEVFRTVATEQEGVAELLSALLARGAEPSAADDRREALLEDIREAILAESGRQLGRLLSENGAAARLRDVLDGRRSVQEVAAELMRRAGEQD